MYEYLFIQKIYMCVDGLQPADTIKIHMPINGKITFKDKFTHRQLVRTK